MRRNFQITDGGDVVSTWGDGNAAGNEFKIYGGVGGSVWVVYTR